MKICMINYENIGLVASNFKIWWINFSKLADVTKLDLLAAPDGCVSIQRCLDRLEKGASRNLQSFRKGTHQVLPLDGVKPGFIIYSSSEEQLCREAPVDHKPETCPCSRAGQQYLRHVRQRIVSRLKGIILPLSCTLLGHLSFLCWLFRTRQQWHGGASPANGHEDDFNRIYITLLITLVL